MLELPLSPTAIIALLFNSTASYKKSISEPPTISCQSISPDEFTLRIQASFWPWFVKPALELLELPAIKNPWSCVLKIERATSKLLAPIDFSQIRDPWY